MGEPLKGKKTKIMENTFPFAPYMYYEKDLKSALEWYKYFKDDANLLVEEFPQYKNKLLKDNIVYEEDGSIWEKDTKIYKDWLLDQAFPDLNTDISEKTEEQDES